jgi:asparagine synthase (glutamine-hydrolysing)
MCGIAGFIDNDLKYNNGSTLVNMVESLKHRGPDNFGYWYSEKKNISIGHSRLSIRDLSKKSNQPIMTSDQRFILTYNGEIYNTKEIKKFLELNYSFFFNQSNPSDTIILLNLIKLNGVEKSLKLLNGMFAFAVIDQKKKELFIVRDNF